MWGGERGAGGACALRARYTKRPGISSGCGAFETHYLAHSVNVPVESFSPCGGDGVESHNTSLKRARKFNYRGVDNAWLERLLTRPPLE